MLVGLGTEFSRLVIDQDQLVLHALARGIDALARRAALPVKLRLLRHLAGDADRIAHAGDGARVLLFVGVHGDTAHPVGTHQLGLKIPHGKLATELLGLHGRCNPSGDGQEKQADCVTHGCF